MAAVRPNIASSIAIVNALILAYAAWVKHSPSRCYFCHQTTYLPVSDLNIAYVGIAMSLFIAVLAHASRVSKRIGFLTLVVSAVCAGVSSYLGIAQIVSRKVCYLCLMGDIGFYLLFIAMLYIAILKPFLYLIGSVRSSAKKGQV